MNSKDEITQKRQYLLGVLGLGLIFSLAWAVFLTFVPPSQVLTLINYLMYFMSVFVIAFPTHSVLKLYFAKSYYAAILVALAWALWTFGVRTFFEWILGMSGVK